MIQFKQLKWFRQNRGLNGFYAVPFGLQYRYSIIKRQDEKFEFAILDHNLEYISGFPKFYPCADDAKDQATRHYLGLLNQHFSIIN